MCSISGVVWGAPVSVEEARVVVRRMNQSLRRRGPDGEGFGVVVDGRATPERWGAGGEPVVVSEGIARRTTSVGLGMNRLAIRDVEAGHQPMIDDSGRVMIVFNGEIYNCDEIEEELRTHGVALKTRCDTEVILRAYMEWGPDCVERLAGMFAFAIWDQRIGTLFIARDRLGIKPLVWARAGDALLFGSELRSLLASGLLEPRVRPMAINRFLYHLYVPPPEGPLENVYILEPGHTLTWSSGKLTIRRYWSPPFIPGVERPLSEHVETFRALLTRSVLSHLVSDVPVGAFLSGGLDSSAVVALMKQGGSNVQTYTVGFDVGAYDESSDAAQSAALLGTSHHEIPLAVKDLEDTIVEALCHYDQPFGDASAVPTYVLCRETSRHVKVALAGDGSDEQLAGYPRAKQFLALEALRVAPAPLRDGIGWLARIGAPHLGSLGRKARNFSDFTQVLASDANDSMAAYIHLRHVFRNGWHARLLSDGFAAAVRSDDPSRHIHEIARRSRAPDRLTAMLEQEVMTYLPGDILQKVDTASGAHGLEVRVPFLDHRLVEAVAQMPPTAKLRPGEAKVVLRRAFHPVLPAHALRKKKRGFHLPVAEWFRSRGRTLLNDVLLSPRARQRGYFEPGVIERMSEEHLSGQVDNGNMLWALLQLELWHRTYVDNRSRQ